MLTLPNILSAVRLVLAGVFVWVYYAVGTVAALIVFLVAGATDLLDGYIARKYNQITDLGKLLDPLADKLLMLCALFCFQDTQRVPLLVFILAAVKEVGMMIGSMYLLRSRKQVVHSNWMGKTAMAAFYAGVLISFIDGVQPYNNILLFIGLALSYLALFSYVRQYLMRGGAHRMEKVNRK